MKYGVLVVTPVSDKEDRSFINIGDMIQAEAIIYIYEQMGIKNEDIVLIELKDINNYKGEYLILPININLSFNWIINIFPLPSHIIPVFLGLSYFSAERLPQELIEYFRYYAPIGCRDEFTLNLMRSHAIPAFLYGCVTAILPARDFTQGGKKVFYVDVPESFEVYCRENSKELSKNIIRLSHICGEERIFDQQYIKKITQELLKLYREEAGLVVTSRLHCMSPCMAIGIPVIPVTDNISPRMGWIDRFLKIFTPENYSSIEWEGQVVCYEKTKALMLDIAIKKIMEVEKRFGEQADLSYYYETRDKSCYGNFYWRILKELPEERKGFLEYILWGAGQIGMNAQQVIHEAFPNSRLKAVIDSYCTGTFFGVPILKPESLKDYEKEYIFITTHSGEKCARKFLESLGKKEKEDFLCMSTTTG